MTAKQVTERRAEAGRERLAVRVRAVAGEAAKLRVQYERGIIPRRAYRKRARALVG